MQTKWELNDQVTWVWGTRYFHTCSLSECLFCKQFQFVKLLGNVLELYKAFIQKKLKKNPLGLDSLVKITVLSHVFGPIP